MITTPSGPLYDALGARTLAIAPQLYQNVGFGLFEPIIYDTVWFMAMAFEMCTRANISTFGPSLLSQLQSQQYFSGTSGMWNVSHSSIHPSIHPSTSALATSPLRFAVRFNPCSCCTYNSSPTNLIERCRMISLTIKVSIIVGTLLSALHIALHV
jgi:hypothetical protein